MSTTNLNTEIITLCLNGLAVCVWCKILHVDLYMIQRNVFKVYRMDDQIWYTSETLHFQNRGKRGPYLVIFSFLNGDSMAKNCCRRPISLVSRCSSNIFRTNGFSQPFSGKSPNIFPTFSQHFPNIFPTFSQHCDLKSLCPRWDCPSPTRCCGAHCYQVQRVTRRQAVEIEMAITWKCTTDGYNMGIDGYLPIIPITRIIWKLNQPYFSGIYWDILG